MMRGNGKGGRGTTDADKQIGVRVKLHRNRVGLSQDELGNHLGVSFQQIQKYEKGANRIGSGRLSEIAQFLGCEVTDLLPEINSKGKATPITPEMRFAASKEGIAIVEAMVKIESPALRRRIISLAESLATA